MRTVQQFRQWYTNTDAACDIANADGAGSDPSNANFDEHPKDYEQALVDLGFTSW